MDLVEQENLLCSLIGKSLVCSLDLQGLPMSYLEVYNLVLKLDADLPFGGFVSMLVGKCHLLH